MHVDDLVEPVREVPLPAVLAPPGRLHGVFGVGLGVGHGGRKVSVLRADAFFLAKKKKKRASWFTDGRVEFVCSVRCCSCTIQVGGTRRPGRILYARLATGV